MVQEFFAVLYMFRKSWFMGNTIVYRNQKLWKIITWLLCIICCFWWWNSIMWWCFISFFTSKIYDDFPSCDDFPYYDDCTSWWYELMWLLLKWPAGQWGSRQEGVQMSRKIVYVQCIFITQKWSKHLFFAVMRHCKERSIVYLALLGLHLKTLPEAQRKQDIVWVWNLVTTFAILYTLSSYSSTTFSMTTITSPIWHKNILSPTWSQTMQFLH